MLRRSNIVSEVPMFSLIALYFEYRKVQTARTAAAHAVVDRVHPANDAGLLDSVARAA